MTDREPSLAERLEESRRTPLGAMTAESAGAIVEHILARRKTETTVTVDVARFGSSI